MQVVPPRTLMECSLCKRLDGNEIIDIHGNNVDDELILPERKYREVPWIQLNKCNHFYHVHCLCRLNPAKYPDDIFIRIPRGTRDTVEPNYDCLDCQGTVPKNSRFNPDMPPGRSFEASTSNYYENSPTAFIRAESLLIDYKKRCNKRINLTTILPIVFDQPTLQEELALIPPLVKMYLNLTRDIDHHRPFVHPFVFSQGGRIIDTVSIPYLHLLDPITIDYDMVSMQTKEMNLRQLFRSIELTPEEKIGAMNTIVRHCKEYIAGDKYAMNDDCRSAIVLRMFTEPTDRTRPFCVVNHRGETKRVVTFNDFPISESTSCSMMGGTRKKRRRKTFRYKV